MVHNPFMCRACAESERAALLCQERIPDYLHQMHLFRRLEKSCIETMSATATTRELSDGSWIFRRGEAATHLYIVRGGQVALSRESMDGRESIIAIVGVDEVFGEELVFLDRCDRDLNARAVGPTTLLCLDRGSVRTLLERSQELSLSLLQTAHLRQRMLLDHIERISLQDAGGRLIAYLLSEAADAPQIKTGSSSCPQRPTHRSSHQHTSLGVRRIRLQMPKHALAAHLAIQPETLSRALARLKRDGSVNEVQSELLIDCDRLSHTQSCEDCERRCWGCPGPATTEGITVSTSGSTTGSLPGRPVSRAY